jgi:integrase
MPKYSKDINLMVTSEMSQGMIDRATNLRDKFMVAIMDFSGARPDELTRLMKKDIVLREDGCMEIKLHTDKLGNKNQFLIKDRILTMRPEMNFFDIIKNYWATSNVETLLSLTVRRMEQIIEQLSDRKLCPYNFRHSRLTKLARTGATLDQLMYWKGANDPRSVGAYIRGKRVEFDRIE